MYCMHNHKNCKKYNKAVIIYENHDLAIARSSSSCADTGLRVAFKCNVIALAAWLEAFKYLNV